MNKFEKVLIAIAVFGVGFFGFSLSVLKLFVSTIKKVEEDER